MKQQVPNTRKNNFVAYLLLLLGFFILIFFTKTLYENLQIALDTKTQRTVELEQKNTDLKRLNELQALLNAEESEELENISGFLAPVGDREMLEYIYSYARDTNLGNNRIIIRDMTFEEDLQSDTGFKQANINVSALFSSEDTLLDFVDYLVSPGSQYQFFITDFSYPMNETGGSMTVQIPLTFYYQ